MVSISCLLEVYQVPPLSAKEAVYEGESSKDGDENHRCGQDWVRQACSSRYCRYDTQRIVTCTTVGQGGDAEQEPDPQTAVEVESDDTGDGDEAEEGEEVAKSL